MGLGINIQERWQERGGLISWYVSAQQQARPRPGSISYQHCLLELLLDWTSWKGIKALAVAFLSPAAFSFSLSPLSSSSSSFLLHSLLFPISSLIIFLFLIILLSSPLCFPVLHPQEPQHHQLWVLELCASGIMYKPLLLAVPAQPCRMGPAWITKTHSTQRKRY